MFVFRLQKSACLETREGVTYATEVDIENPESDISEIPAPNLYPAKEPVYVLPEHVPVYFDLETTGLGMINTRLCYQIR